MVYGIKGGTPLRGTVRLQGAKNSVLPILAASLLCTDGRVRLENCPSLEDVQLSQQILESLGCRVARKDDALEIHTDGRIGTALDERQCAGMRSSVLFLGPLLASAGRAELFLPGGCLLGERPVNLHIDALRRMGANIRLSDNKILAEAPDGLVGREIVLPFPSVGATENIMMAAALARGATRIIGAAAEPEIEDLADFIRKMGGVVRKDGNLVEVFGVPSLHGCTKRIIPDRIAGFTYLAAALATDGRVTVQGCEFDHMRAMLDFLSLAGGAVEVRGNDITVYRAGPCLLPVKGCMTAPYPGFPTDAGAMALVLMSLAGGASSLHEGVFSDRFAVVEELKKLGADITPGGATASVRGGKLCGATVHATDLRAGAALVIAALSAEGESTVTDSGHILRGYERFGEILRALGAQITERNL